MRHELYTVYLFTSAHLLFYGCPDCFYAKCPIHRCTCTYVHKNCTVYNSNLAEIIGLDYLGNYTCHDIKGPTKVRLQKLRRSPFSTIQ